MASWVGFAWVEFFRNTPLLVQAVSWSSSAGTGCRHRGTLAEADSQRAVLHRGDRGRTVHVARVAEQLRAGIGSLPRGQKLAATALGLTTAQTYRYVLLPMAFRIIMPPSLPISRTYQEILRWPSPSA